MSPSKGEILSENDSMPSLTEDPQECSLCFLWAEASLGVVRVNNKHDKVAWGSLHTNYCYEYVTPCVTIYDYVWLCTTMYNYKWLYMNMYDYLWLCMTMYDYVWLCMTMYD